LPWIEGTLSASVAPDVISNALTTLGAVVANETVEFDVTSAVTGNGTFSFAILPNSGDEVKYYTKEGTGAAPLLIITTGSGGGEITEHNLSVSTEGSGSVSLSPSGGTYPEGTVVEASADPDAGWLFSHWSGALSGSDATQSVVMNSDKQITAVFEPEDPTQYVLNVDVQGSGVVSLSPSGGVYDDGTEVELTASANLGWQFDSWSGDASSSQITITVTMTEDKNIAASFSEVSDEGGEIFTFEPTDDGQVKLTDHGANYGDKSTAKVEANKFASYFKFEVSGLSQPVHTARLKFYAVAESEDGGSVYTVSNDYQDGSAPWDEAELTAGNAPETISQAIANLGKVVVGDVVTADVTSAIDGNGVFSFAIFSNTTDRSKYYTREGTVPPLLIIETGSGDGGTTQYSLSVTTEGSGSVDLNPSGGVYAAGASVLLTADPDDGWQFSHWTGDLDGTDATETINMTANKQVTAVFVEETVTQYTLTVDVEGSGTVTLSPEGGVYNEGTEVELTATPESGWEFDSWSDDASGSETTVTVTMDSDKQVTATFAEQVSANAVVFNPIDDAQVKSTSPSTNFGGEDLMRVRWGSPIFTSYIKFDVTGISSPIVKATLRLYVDDGGPDGGDVYVVDNTYKGESNLWREGGLIWDNAPVIEGDEIARIGAATAGQWVEVDITSAIPGNGLYSFGLMNNESNSVMYATRQTANAPELVIETETSLAKSGKDKLTLNAASLLPDRIQLRQNYPNPFNAGTTIEYALPTQANVELTVFNVTGQKVKPLVDGVQEAGFKKVTWQGKNDRGLDVGSGIYFINMSVGKERFVRKVTLQK